MKFMVQHYCNTGKSFIFACMDAGLISFGDGVGDSSYSGGDNEIVLDLDISIPVVFYQERLTKIYVSRISSDLCIMYTQVK